jgi:hypothetical protein
MRRGPACRGVEPEQCRAAALRQASSMYEAAFDTDFHDLPPVATIEQDIRQ